MAKRITGFAHTVVADAELGGGRLVKGGVDAGFGVTRAKQRGLESG